MRQSLLENASGFVQAIQGKICETQVRDVAGIVWLAMDGFLSFCKPLLMLAQNTVGYRQVVHRSVVSWICLRPQLAGLDGLRHISANNVVIVGRNVELLAFTRPVAPLKGLLHQLDGQLVFAEICVCLPHGRIG